LPWAKPVQSDSKKGVLVMLFLQRFLILLLLCFVGVKVFTKMVVYQDYCEYSEVIATAPSLESVIQRQSVETEKSQHPLFILNNGSGTLSFSEVLYTRVFIKWFWWLFALLLVGLIIVSYFGRTRKGGAEGGGGC